MLKQADVVRQAFEKKKKKVYFSVIKGNASALIIDKSNDPQTRGRIAKLKLEFSRIGSHSQCRVCLSQPCFGHSRNNSTIGAFKIFTFLFSTDYEYLMVTYSSSHP